MKIVLPRNKVEKTITIGTKKLGADNQAFIIAELSANHGHDIKIAKKTIKAMKDSGADAVKLQTYTPDTITINCNNDFFKVKQDTLWDGRTLYDLYSEAYMPWSWQPELKKYAESLGIVLFSSPFDKSAVDFLEKMDVPAYKIASFEITDIPLIKYVASKGKPIIISTGIARKKDIIEAIKTCKNQDNSQIVLLKCTSAYPAPFEEINLLTIPDMAKKFRTIIGISDHTSGSAVSVGACTLGAKVVEKHFILDRKIGGPDATFSMEPVEFKQMVNDIRNMEKALGKVDYQLTSKAKKSREFSRSLFVVEDINKGEKFSERNVRSIRPAFGLAPKLISRVLGKKARKDIKRGTPLKVNMIEKCS